MFKIMIWKGTLLILSLASLSGCVKDFHGLLFSKNPEESLEKIKKASERKGKDKICEFIAREIDDEINQQTQKSDKRYTISRTVFDTVRHTKTADAIIHCKSLEPGTPRWAEAFYALKSHPMEEIIPYIDTLFPSVSTNVRYYCYHFCYERRSDYLLNYAIADFDDTSTSPGLNLPPDEVTLGFMAQKYVRSVDETKCDRAPLPKGGSLFHYSLESIDWEEIRSRDNQQKSSRR